jgi:hypothetical protein
MPYLFCEEHGRDREALFAQEQENYRRFGETMLVVTGPLKTASCCCHSCNARLRRGQRGYLVTAFPRPLAEGMDAYEYAAEREYLVLEHAEARLYGAEPPVAMPDPAHVPNSNSAMTPRASNADRQPGGGAA